VIALSRLAAIVVAVGVIAVVRPADGRDAGAERLTEESIPEEQRWEDGAGPSTEAVGLEPDVPRVLAHSRATLETGSADESVPVVDGARVSSTSTYRLDPDRDVVEVTTEYTMTNVSPDRDLGGGGFEYYFYDGMVAPLHPEVRELTVLVDDRPASYDIEPGEGLDSVVIEFESDLRFNQTFTIDIDYDLAGSEPRRTTDVTRVNDAYASFDVFAFADDHEAAVTVLIPEGWEVEHTEGEFQRTVGFGQQVYEAADIAW
jgi:hypothetical protein